MGGSHWQPGEHIVRREVWRDRVWAGMDAVVVSDSPAELVLLVPTGAPMGYPPGDWPTATGRHPWAHIPRWTGHGCLMTHVPGEDFSVFHFWNGDERTFDCWYLNLQEPFRRTPIGIDTLDHEVDVIVRRDGTVELKDVDAIGECVRHGRFDVAFADAVVERGRALAERARQGVWWDRRWADWSPPAEWSASDELPQGWAAPRPSPAPST